MPPKPKPKLEWNDPDLQIVPKKVRHKTNKPTIEKVEHQKKVINKLHRKIQDKNKELVVVRASRDKNKAIRKYVNRKAISHRVNYERRRTNAIVRNIIIRTNRKANLIVKDKIKKATLENLDYLNSVSSFPIILSWCKEAGIQFDTFSVFILINHFEWFSNVDGMFFGYNKNVTTRHLKKLVDRELAQCIRSTKVTYVSTELGKQTFIDFKKYHDERLAVLIEQYEKQFNPNQNPLKLKKKILKKRKPNGDQQENTDGTTGS